MLGYLSEKKKIFIYIKNKWQPLTRDVKDGKRSRFKCLSPLLWNVQGFCVIGKVVIPGWSGRDATPPLYQNQFRTVQPTLPGEEVCSVQ